MSRERALVTGATGYIGMRLVSALHRAGYAVTASARRPRMLEEQGWPAEVGRVRLDVSEADSCRQALGDPPPRGSDPSGAGRVGVAYYLVHALGTAGFSARDRAAARTFAAACAEAGVRRVVYLGGLVPDGETLSEHLESRVEVGEELQRSGVEVVWLRAAVILGAGSASYEFIRQTVARLPVIPVPEWMHRPVQPVAVDDVLHYLVAAADPATVPPGGYDITGEEALSYADLVRRFLAVTGRRRLLVPAPAVPVSLAAPLAGRLSPLPGGLGRDLVESLANTMSGTEQLIRTLVPDKSGGLTGIDEALRRAGRTRAGRALEPVHRVPDPLRLTANDPAWARRGR